MNPRYLEIKQAIEPLRELLVEHPLYTRLETLEDLRVFMEHHIFAVWDFMSLLKALQRHFTCVDVPWVPRGDRLSRRLVNEIVLAEESDEDGAGGYIGHYELYHEAMRQCGADTRPVEDFLARLGAGAPVLDAAKRVNAPTAAVVFVDRTWEIIARGRITEIASAFTLGREDLIPSMFRVLVEDLQRKFPGKLATFLTYLERHIDLDEEHHTPMAVRMLEAICGDDAARWREVEDTAVVALKARIDLWDGVLEQLTRGAAAGR